MAPRNRLPAWERKGGSAPIVTPQRITWRFNQLDHAAAVVVLRPESCVVGENSAS